MRIYTQFYGDNLDVANWSVNSMPNFSNTIIDSTVHSSYMDYTDLSLSRFYKEMSNGTLNVIGKVYPQLITTSNPWSYYSNNNKNFGYVNQEVIRKVNSIDSLNNNINFSEFDNYGRTYANGDFNLSSQPDGRIDLVVIIYRAHSSIDTANKVIFGGWSSIACLSLFQPNSSSTCSDCGFNSFMTNESKSICGAYNDYAPENGTNFLSGGITLRYKGQNLPDLTNILAHEFGHYLFNGHCDGYGMMSEGSVPHKSLYSSSMSSIEKNKLDYINYPTITPGTEYELGDYLSTNQAYKYEIANLPTGYKEWFIIENHQKISVWDGVGGKRTMDDALKGKGLYIFHYYDRGPAFYELIWPESADGKWNWTSCTTSGKTVYTRIEPSRSYGTNEWDIEQKYKEGHCNPTATDETNEAYGENEDAFNVGYNQLFSPYSNPNTVGMYSTITLHNFAIEITRQVGSSIYFKVHTTPLNAPPSKPQFLKVTYNSSVVPTLKWYKNVESDVVGYNVWRAVHKNSETNLTYDKLNLTPITDTVYQDNTPLPSSITGNNYDSIFISYKVAAVDNQTPPNESVASDTAKFLYALTLSGNTASSRTWYNRMIVMSNVTISGGATITIPSPARIEFKSGTSMTFNGSLSAVGTSDNKITFTSLCSGDYWGGILVSGSSAGSSVLEYCKIEKTSTNAGAALTIQNTNGRPRISYCEISGHTPNGTSAIITNNANTEIYKNKLENNQGSGVYCYNYSGSQFGNDYLYNDNTSGNNKITNNTWGLKASGYSSIFMGDDETPNYTYNNISGNTYANCQVAVNSTVSSCWTYWGYPIDLTKFINDGTGTIYTMKNFSTAPSAPFLKISSSGQKSGIPELNNNIIASEFEDNFKKAKSLFLKGKYQESKDILQSIVSATKSEDDILKVTSRLLEIYRMNLDEDIFNYITNNDKVKSSSITDASSKLALANALTCAGNIDLALNQYGEVIKSYPKTEAGKTAAIQKAFIYYLNKNDEKSANNILADLEQNYKDDDNVRHLKSILSRGFLPEVFNKETDSNEKSGTTTKTALGFSLSNYPNPFNPSTVIRYSIPQNLFVKLVVYDITGKEVKVLVNEIKTAGTYNAEFNADKYASGVYYYKLEAGDYKNIQKMILVK